MKERIEYIDTAKGLLIIMMLIGHTWNSGYAHDFIYTFHMPAFFVITGFLLNYSSAKEKPLLQNLVARVKSLLVPYLFFEVFAIVLKILQNGPQLNVKGYLFEICSLHLFNGPLWFLMIMFLSSMAFILLRKLIDGKYKWPVLLLLLAAIMLLPKYEAYISITTFAEGLFFIILGYAAKSILQRKSVPWMLASLAVIVVMPLINVCGGMPAYQDGNRVLFVLGAIAGSYFIIQASKYISFKPLLFFGKNSIIILGTHYPLLNFVKSAFAIEEFGLINGLVFLLCLLAVEIPIIYIINNYLPFVIGKPYKCGHIKNEAH